MNQDSFNAQNSVQNGDGVNNSYSQQNNSNFNGVIQSSTDLNHQPFNNQQQFTTQNSYLSNNQNTSNKGPAKKNKSGFTIGVIVLVIAIICGVIFGGKYVLDSKNKVNSSDKGNNSTKENDNLNNLFSTDKYRLIYNTVDLSDKYWEEKGELMSHRDYFMGRYTFKVLGQSNTDVGGNLSMPFQPSYTMYYRLTAGGGATETCEYFVKVDFNNQNVFFPNSIYGTLDGTSDNAFRFYVLDNNMNFNMITPSFNHLLKTSIERIQNYEIVYQKDNWEISSISQGDKTYIYADYFINREKRDYFNFTAKIDGKLDNEQIDEFVNKLVQNIDISIITDEATKEYLKTKNNDYVVLKDNTVKLGDSFNINTSNIKFRLWSNSNKKILVPSNSSTKNVNLFQWYDDSFGRIQLFEYPNVINDIETVCKGFFGTDLEIQDYTYNNISLKAIYDRNNSYRKLNGYSDLVGFAFKVDNNVYTVETSKYLIDSEIDSYLKYLFENVLISK